MSSQPPYLDIIDVPEHAPLRPWKTPTPSDEFLRHCKPGAREQQAESSPASSGAVTRCQDERCTDENGKGPAQTETQERPQHARRAM